MAHLASSAGLVSLLLLSLDSGVANIVEHEDSDAAGEEIPVNVDCDEGLEDWKRGWSDLKKNWCCETEHKGCDPPFKAPFDCWNELADSNRWTADKKEWCCDNEHQGCGEHPYDCEADLYNWKHSWSHLKKEWCCVHAQRGWTGCLRETEMKAKTDEVDKKRTYEKTDKVGEEKEKKADGKQEHAIKAVEIKRKKMREAELVAKTKSGSKVMQEQEAKTNSKDEHGHKEVWSKERHMKESQSKQAGKERAAKERRGMNINAMTHLESDSKEGKTKKAEKANKVAEKSIKEFNKHSEGARKKDEFNERLDLARENEVVQKKKRAEWEAKAKTKEESAKTYEASKKKTETRVKNSVKKKKPSM